MTRGLGTSPDTVIGATPIDRRSLRQQNESDLLQYETKPKPFRSEPNMMKKTTQRQLSFRLCALAMAAALTACGGGDDPVGTVVPTDPVPTDPVPVTTPAVVALPAAGESTGVTDAGVTDEVDLNYLVFSPDGSTRVVPAVVAYAQPNGTLTLQDTAGDLLISTNDEWATIIWPDGFDGALQSNGNAGLVCDTTTGAGEVGFSGNMVQVTDLSLLNGKSFRLTECTTAGVTSTPTDIRFNADGTATDVDGTLTAAQVMALFTDSGLVDPVDSSVYKLRAFAHNSGGGTKYFMVLIADDRSSGSSVKSVLLYSEEALPS